MARVGERPEPRLVDGPRTLVAAVSASAVPPVCGGSGPPPMTRASSTRDAAEPLLGGSPRLRITPSPPHTGADIGHPIGSLAVIRSELELGRAARGRRRGGSRPGEGHTPLTELRLIADDLTG